MTKPNKQAMDGKYETYRHLFARLGSDLLPPREAFDASYDAQLEDWFSSPEGQAFAAWANGVTDQISDDALARVRTVLQTARQLAANRSLPDQSNGSTPHAGEKVQVQISAKPTKPSKPSLDDPSKWLDESMWLKTNDRATNSDKSKPLYDLSSFTFGLDMISGADERDRAYSQYKKLFSDLNMAVLPEADKFTDEDAKRIKDWLNTQYGKAFESWAIGEKPSLSKSEYDTIERDLWLIKTGKAPPTLPAIDILPLHKPTPMERPLLLGKIKILPERALDTSSLQAYFQPDEVLPSRYFDIPFTSPSKSKPSTPKLVKKATVTPSPNPPQDQKRTAPQDGPPKNLINMPPSFGALSKMPGLGPVKEAIHAQVSLAMVNKKRAAAGGKQLDTTRHMVFRGNPGTGKTEVARVIGKIFHEIGVLTRGHCVEVDRGALVSKWIGGTAEDTDRMIKQAFGGVLFIDEAYSLTPEDPGRDSGKESIDKLLKMMEDHRNDLIVIAAGYQKEMDRFLDSNPGLRSRFAVTIDFPDYDASEMVAIFLMMCEKDDFKLSPDAKTKLREVLQAVHQRRGIQFGNGRVVRNLLDDCVKRHAVRVAEQENPSYSTLTTLTPKDIPDRDAFK